MRTINVNFKYIRNMHFALFSIYSFITYARNKTRLPILRKYRFFIHVKISNAAEAIVYISNILYACFFFQYIRYQVLLMRYFKLNDVFFFIIYNYIITYDLDGRNGSFEWENISSKLQRTKKRLSSSTSSRISVTKCFSMCRRQNLKTGVST